jgi:hypothetical protein
MNAKQRESPPLPKDAILNQLDKVLSSALFQSSERPNKLLRFLVDQTLKVRRTA